MKTRYAAPAAVMAVFIQNNRILLQKRMNTGYMDGYYDCAASGHVEKDESLKEAMVREISEELGIQVDIRDLRFLTLIHKHDEACTYLNVYFLIEKNYSGFKINEPDKCSELLWADLNDLPHNLIPERKQAVFNFLNGIPYSETGWDDKK